jgi:DNA-binding IclR family transcriptional regulator
MAETRGDNNRGALHFSGGSSVLTLLDGKFGGLEVQEIADALDLTWQQANDAMNTLLRHGLVVCEPRRAGILGQFRYVWRLAGNGGQK